jgi:hypothetical protein
MEVHHHSHHPKKIKEYITEFLMLFLAVSLGFFAENLREHQVEKEREIKFLQNIHLDLKNDMSEIDKIINFNYDKQKMGDSLLNAYASGKLIDSLPDFYFYIRNITLRNLFENSKNGFIQLKNAGGLRMIENKKIINDIQQYENQILKIDRLQDISEATFQNFRFKATKILDVNTSNQMNKEQDTTNPVVTKFVRFRRPLKPNPLLTYDKKEINELLNLVSYALNTNTYIVKQLKTLKKDAIDLDNYILKEYGEKFD